MTGKVRPLRVLVAGGDDLAAAVLTHQEGGRASISLGERVTAGTGGGVAVAIDHVPGCHAGELALEHHEQIAAADVLLHSLAPELARPLSGRALVDAVEADFQALIEQAKQVGTWVIVLNACTLDPADRSQGFTDPQAIARLDRHRLDLLLIELSRRHGISIVDADRIVAEIGGEGNVTAPLAYSPTLSDRLGAEVHYVLEDYGFFDDRPLLEQRGTG